MVNTSLARPPQAEIEALWWRVGNSVNFSVQVKNLSSMLMADPADAVPPAAAVSLQALETVSWTAQMGAPWLTIAPTSGSTDIQPIVSVVTSALALGWQQGTVTFTTTSGDPFSDTLTVHVYCGTVWRVHVPCAMR